VRKITIEEHKEKLIKNICMTTYDIVHFHIVPRILSTWAWYKMN